MSKQYLTTHTVDNAHPTDIFALAASRSHLLTVGGSSSLKIYSTDPNPPSSDAGGPFPIVQTIPDAHPLGCHHVAVSASTAPSGGSVRAASAGFGGEVRLWCLRGDTGEWAPLGGGVLVPRADAARGKEKKDVGGAPPQAAKGAADVWAVALSADGRYLAGTTHDGRIGVWDLGTDRSAVAALAASASLGGGKGGKGAASAVAADVPPPEKIREYTTVGGSGGGSFGLCIDLSQDGKWTASGHQDGAAYVFNNDTGRLVYSLSGLTKAIRAVSFSPGSKRLACAGDAGVIALYDMSRGEHVSNLALPTSLSASGSGASSGSLAPWITALDWSDTGEWLLSGSVDGKVRVWSVERGVCVAAHSETDGALWSVKWLKKTGRNEFFATAGENRSISFYREATGSG